MKFNRTAQDGGTLGLVRTVVLVLIVIVVVVAILLRTAPGAASLLACQSGTLYEVEAEQGCPDSASQVSGFTLEGDDTVCCQKKPGVSQSAFEEDRARTSSIRNAEFTRLPETTQSIQETTFTGTYVENGQIVRTQAELPRQVYTVPNAALNNPENVITVIAGEPFTLPFVHNYPSRRDIAKCRSDIRGTQFLSGAWTQTRRTPDGNFMHTGELFPCEHRDVIILKGSLDLERDLTHNVYKWDWTYWDEDGNLIQDIGGAALIKVVDEDDVGVAGTGTEVVEQVIAYYELYPQGNKVYCIESPTRTNHQINLEGNSETKEQIARLELKCSEFIDIPYSAFEVDCRGVTCSSFDGSNRRWCDSEWDERSIEACRYILSCYKPGLFDEGLGTRCKDCREVNIDLCEDYNNERNCEANQCLGVDTVCEWTGSDCVEAD